MPRNRKKPSPGDSQRRSQAASPADCPSEDEAGAAVCEQELHQAIENTSFRRQQTRVSAYRSVCEGLVQRYCPGSLAGRKMALVESVKRSLRKGNEEERLWATSVIPLLALQSETCADVLELVETFKPVMIGILTDVSLGNSNVRMKCCSVLGMLCFIGEDERADEIVSLVKILQQTIKNVPDPVSGDFQAVVLRSWTLLLTLLSPHKILEHVKSANLLSPRDLMAMLDSNNLEVRTASGESLALMHELLCQHDSSFFQEDLPDLLNTVRKLSTDSYRFQGKRGRKLQRITFRDVLLYLQEGVVPEMRIKFGDETLVLNSWMMHRRYDCLKDVLGMALNVHLEENALVRDLLKLGPKVERIVRCSGGRIEKEFRHSFDASKERSIARGKERDKRLFHLE
uniref:interferon-related developmental regulator 2-like n=1 Tax=Anopheles coluzzii TaxID=1518534 RepID=UPI0020FFECE1|nr:interferon-related developmental regulator 2-like [Anopheles coluzzii]